MPELNSVVRLAVFELVVLNQQAQSKEKKDRKYIKGSNFRIPHKSFTCHWIRIASIVLCLDLQSLPTHVSEADQSCGVFWSLAHKRYVDDNLLQLLILKLFVGSFTKCSDLKLAAITNYGAWRCFLTHKIHVRQPSFHFVQQTEQFSACQKLCSSDAPQFWWLFLEKKVRIIYTGKYGSKPLDTLCCWFMLVFFNLLLGLLQD